MPISQISPYGTYGSSATYLSPVKKTYQPAKASSFSTPKAYSVELSHSAQARSLKQQGYPLSMISIETGLPISIIMQYLGISVSDTNSTMKSTYVQPKEKYTDPREITQGIGQFMQELNQFNIALAQYSWTNLMSKLIPSGKTE